MTAMTAEESRALALLKDRGIERPTWSQIQELVDSDRGEIPWTGHYDKEHYLVLLDDERVLCWPNAGLMNACDGSGRVWGPDGLLRVQRITEGHPRHPLSSSRRSRHSAPLAALSVVAGLAGVSLYVPPKRPCAHRFGLAGGFSECSACGVKKRGAR